MSHCEGSYLLGSCKPSHRGRLSLAFSFSLCFFSLSVLLRPVIYQFAIDSNIPISRQAQKQLNRSLKLKKSEYKNTSEAIMHLDSVEYVERGKMFSPVDGN